MAAAIRLWLKVRLLLLWLAGLREAGVRCSSNMINVREHVMVSCTYSLTRTRLSPCLLKAIYKYTGVLVFITQSAMLNLQLA